jgi:hypothetical protein
LAPKFTYKKRSGGKLGCGVMDSPRTHKEFFLLCYCFSKFLPCNFFMNFLQLFKGILNQRQFFFTKISFSHNHFWVTLSLNLPKTAPIRKNAFGV